MNEKVMLLGKVTRFTWGNIDDEFRMRNNTGTISYVKKTKLGYEFGAIGHGDEDAPRDAWAFLNDADVAGTERVKRSLRYRLKTLNKYSAPIGVILAQKNCGAVGILSPKLVADTGEWINVGKAVIGPAQLLSQTKDGAPFYQDVVIMAFGSGLKGDEFEIVGSPDLIFAHGMSGSPVMQNGKFVGILCMAKTHHIGIAANPEYLLGAHEGMIKNSIESLQTVDSSGAHHAKQILKFLDETGKESVFKQMLRAHEERFPPPPPPSKEELQKLDAENQQRIAEYAKRGMLRQV